MTGCKNDSGSTGSGCTTCHHLEIDQHHQFACTSCHRGNDKESTIEGAHINLVSQPAHPENAVKYCGPCHQSATEMVTSNSHYTLSGYLKAIFPSGTSESSKGTLDNIKASAVPANITELLDDMLRRKCLRCHVYTRGDDFPLTSRATGCGSCHLKFYDGKMVSHLFHRPDTKNCLTCHYGNRVGFDYFGRFEHDLNEEYRTPYTTENDFFRPYGVEYHQLEPDIHQKAGMVCTDCHNQQQVMGDSSNVVTCSSCHEMTYLETSLIETISQKDNQYIVTSSATGKQFTVPVMTHPAHARYNDTVACQVCHAQWGYNDFKTHLLRVDHDYFDEFDRLSLDGDSRVHQIITSNISLTAESIEPNSTDFFTDITFPGIWLKGYSERRWENLQLARGGNGKIQVTRPLLDIYLSWIDSDEIVRFDNVSPFPEKQTNLFYTPHTTGPAGPFYEVRLKQFLRNEKSSDLVHPDQNH